MTSTPAGQFWRAASFALCACVIVVSYFWTRAVDNNNQLAMAALGNNFNQLKSVIGPLFDDYEFNARSSRVAFSPLNQAGAQRAALHMIEDSDKAMLVYHGLPKLDASIDGSSQYTLLMKTADGIAKVMARFTSDGGFGVARVPLDRVASSLKNVTWEISGPHGVVLASL